jgi:hypothetical protein
VRMFFGSPDLGLETAAAGGFTLVPNVEMRASLAKDYEAMSGMVFGEVPPLADVLAAIATLEALPPAEPSLLCYLFIY